MSDPKVAPSTRQISPVRDRADRKVCSRCGDRKPLDAFARNPARKDGRSGVCKTCLYGLDNQRKRDRDLGIALARAAAFAGDA